MASQQITPVIIGVGDIKNRSLAISDAFPPHTLMLQALSSAISDTSLSSASSSTLKASINSISVVNTWTWRYGDLPGLIGRELGVKEFQDKVEDGGGDGDRKGMGNWRGKRIYKETSHHGGDSPAKMVDEAARRVARGESKVAVVVGGEALASLSACATAGKLPPPDWPPQDETARSVSVSDVSRFGDNLGSRHSVGLPIHVYPLYEAGFRSLRGQSLQENNEESAELYEEFAKVAEGNEFAWNYGRPAADAKTIGTVSKKNRMICTPYPLLMNAFNNVNLAAACILTSTSYARELGIPESKWIYPLGGAGTSDSSNFWERPNFYSSPAIERSLDEALRVTKLAKDDVNVFDFYSCFPIVPKLACHHLGIPILESPRKRPITLLGGLTSFGGAGNNYSMHAITAIVRALRKGADHVKTGLVLANGGVLTYQHVIILSSQAPSFSYPEQNPLPEILVTAAPVVDEQAEGEGVIETYTIEFHRNGHPHRAHIIGRLLSTSARFIANHGDVNTLLQLSDPGTEQIGLKGLVSQAGDGDGRSVFILEDTRESTKVQRKERL